MTINQPLSPDAGAPDEQTEEAHLNRLCAILVGRIPPEQVSSRDWHALVDLARHHHVSAYLWEQLYAHADQMPAEVAEALRAESLHAAAHAALLERAYQSISAALQRQGIPQLWIKGIALANTVYPVPHTRTMIDLDLIVPQEQCAPALALLIGLGFELLAESQVIFAHQAAVTDAFNHHFVLRQSHAGSGAVKVEIHYRLFGAHAQHLEGDALAWFWGHTYVLPSGMITLQPETHLVYLCAHIMMQHGELEIELARFLDLHLLVTHQPLDWDAVSGAARHMGWRYSVWRALQLTHRYFGTVIPGSLWGNLLDGEPAPPDQALVMSLQTRNTRWPKTKQIMKSLSWRERLAYMRRVLLPPRAYMRTRYGIAATTPVWPYYPYRWLGQAGQVVNAVFTRLFRRDRRSMPWK